jgi:hypothetical protein
MRWATLWKYQSISPDETGEGGNLIIEPADIAGNYDYIPDVETMKAPSSTDVKNELMQVVAMVLNPQVVQMLMAEGKQPKIMEILTRAFEATNVIKDAEALFEDVKQPMQQGGGVLNEGQVVQGGAGGPTGGVPPQGAMPAQGMGAGGAPTPNQSNAIGGGGPTQVPAGL